MYYDFRPPKIRNSYRSPEIHYQNNLYGISSFHFYHWNQISTVQSVHKTYSQIFCDVQCELTKRQITLTSLSHRQPITIDY